MRIIFRFLKNFIYLFFIYITYLCFLQSVCIRKQFDGMTHVCLKITEEEQKNKENNDTWMFVYDAEKGAKCCKEILSN